MNKFFGRKLNPKLQLATSKYGWGLFAKEILRQGEEIEKFDGKFYTPSTLDQLKIKKYQYIRDHVIQVANNKWRGSLGFAHFLNHSCTPNCQIRNRYTIIASKDIPLGEELTWDYDFTEDSNWQMSCQCGSVKCKGKVNGFKYNNTEWKLSNKNSTSLWLTEKYKNLYI